MTSVISLNSAVAFVKGFPVISGVDLEVSPRQRLMLTGANGSGKTSLLKLIAGLIPLTKGSGKVLGLDLKTQVKSIRKQVFYLGHTTRLYDELTVEENLSFYLKLTGASKKLISELTSWALSEVGLGTNLTKVRSKHLSFGQKRRLSLATLLVRQPRIVLLDEPHANLDQEGRRLIDDFIITYTTKQQATLIFASHEIERCVKLASSIATLKGGRIISVESANSKSASFDVA